MLGGKREWMLVCRIGPRKNGKNFDKSPLPTALSHRQFEQLGGLHVQHAAYPHSMIAPQCQPWERVHAE